MPVRDRPPRIVIMGAAHGIGRLCALSLSDGDFELVLSDHDGASLNAVCSSIGALGRFCDVASEASVEIFAAELLERFDAIDGLIVAAGSGHIRSLGMWRVARALMPAMRRSNSALIVGVGPAPESTWRDHEFPFASSGKAFVELTAALVTSTRGSGVEVASVEGAAPRSARQRRHSSACTSDVLALLAKQFGLPPFGGKDLQDTRRTA